MTDEIACGDRPHRVRSVAFPQDELSRSNELGSLTGSVGFLRMGGGTYGNRTYC
jgi:hypothetical protein